MVLTSDMNIGKFLVYMVLHSRYLLFNPCYPMYKRMHKTDWNCMYYPDPLGFREHTLYKDHFKQVDYDSKIVDNFVNSTNTRFSTIQSCVPCLPIVVSTTNGINMPVKVIASSFQAKWVYLLVGMTYRVKCIRLLWIQLVFQVYWLRFLIHTNRLSWSMDHFSLLKEGVWLCWKYLICSEYYNKYSYREWRFS